MHIYVDVSSDDRQIGKTKLAAFIVRKLKEIGVNVEIRSATHQMEKYLAIRCEEEDKSFMLPKIIVRDEMPWPRAELLLKSQLNVLVNTEKEIEIIQIALSGLRSKIEYRISDLKESMKNSYDLDRDIG